MARAASVLGPRELPAGPRSLSEDAAALSRAWRLILVSVVAGVAVTVLWSFQLVDSTIGDNVADNLLGYDAKGAAIDGAGTASKPGGVTRFTAGALLIAGTFTFTYWVLRVPAAFGIGWWPSMPWS